MSKYQHVFCVTLPRITKPEVPPRGPPVWKGRRSFRIWSFPGSYANRGSGMEKASSDVMQRGNPNPNQVSSLHGVSARGDGESPFAFERGGSTRAFGAAPESGHPKGCPLRGPSDRIRTCGIVVPNHARYQLRYTRIVRENKPSRKSVAIIQHPPRGSKRKIPRGAERQSA